MNTDPKEIELKEIPTPMRPQKSVSTKVNVGSPEFFEALANTHNRIVEIIELNEPAELKSFSISSDIENSLDIIAPILIKNFKEKGWQLSVVKEPKRVEMGMPDFNREYAECSITEISFRSKTAKFFNIIFSIFFANTLSLLLIVAVIGIPIFCSSWIILEYVIKPKIDITSQLIKVGGAEATLEDADGNISRIAVEDNVLGEKNIGKCFRHIDKTNKLGRKEWSVANCSSIGLAEYGADDGLFGELYSVKREGNRSKIEFKNSYGSFVVDEPSHDVLRNETGNHFRYNDFRADGGERKLTKINRKN